MLPLSLFACIAHKQCVLFCVVHQWKMEGGVTTVILDKDKQETFFLLLKISVFASLSNTCMRTHAHTRTNINAFTPMPLQTYKQHACSIYGQGCWVFCRCVHHSASGLLCPFVCICVCSHLAQSRTFSPLPAFELFTFLTHSELGLTLPSLWTWGHMH